jgi:hypothetical protein
VRVHAAKEDLADADHQERRRVREAETGAGAAWAECSREAGGELVVVRGAVQVAENDQAAARADGDGIADTFSGFAAFGLRVTKKGGDVHTASSRKH